MAYTISEFAKMDLSKIRKDRTPRCVCEGAKDSTYRCTECYWAEFSDFIDAHPIGVPGSWRGSTPR